MHMKGGGETGGEGGEEEKERKEGEREKVRLMDETHIHKQYTR